MTGFPARRAAFAVFSLSLLGVAIAQTRPDISVLAAPKPASPAPGHLNANGLKPFAQSQPGKMSPELLAPAAKEAIRLERVVIRGEVVGHAARTRIEMIFRNPNPQVLEGELQFPLYDGQSVAGFALDINGELRDAVPVDKAKGQQVFEDTIRRRVDPGLLEATQGNNYKLRIYPLPAGGTRRVALDIVESLPANGRQARYRLPLQFSGANPDIDFQLKVDGRTAAQIHGQGAAADVRVVSRDGLSVAELASARLTGDQAFSLLLDDPADARPVVATQDFDHQTWFYVEAPVPDSAVTRPRPVPKTMGLVWDASGSGAQRDHAREFALLDGFFRRWGNLDVKLVLARDTADNGGMFNIRNGDWRELRHALEHTAYDGATAAQALSAPSGVGLSLLFSDGLVNYGEPVKSAAAAPVFTISAADGNNAAFLRHVADTSGGAFLDLDRLDTDAALTQLTSVGPRLLSWSGEGVGQVTVASRQPENGRLLLAGALDRAQGNLSLKVALADGSVRTLDIPIRDDAGGALAATRWAALRLAELQTDADANRDEIRRIGSRFNLVTPETSLIVLDNVWDYVNHEITPPESLLPEYQRLMAQRIKGLEQDRSRHLENVVARFEEKVRWWERDFTRDPVPVTKQKAMSVGAMAAALQLRMEESAPRRMQDADSARQRHDAPAAPAAAPMAAAEKAELNELREKKDSNGEPVTGAITLTPWQPDAPYSRALRNAAPEETYARYLDVRDSWRNSPAFYLDAADILFSKGQERQALRVLSNLAEMNLENRAVLRVLAYRLQQAKQARLAIPVLRKVLALAPDEPQSWRDLGLAYADAGQTQLAVDNLWQVVSRPWNGRFPDVEQIALEELNALVANSRQRIDTRAIDPRLLRNLPLGLRVTLSWDADNTDIDLHVTDPRNEEAYYGNPLTAQGGRMSADFTGGYGPEEFSLRRPFAGKYVVFTHFFGDRSQTVTNGTTLQVRISTNFGTRKQKDEIQTVRLTRPSDRVEIGAVTIEP